MKPAWYATLDANGRRAFWTTYAGFTLDAMDVQLYAFVLPALLALWGLSHAQAGLLAAAALGASALGGWTGGILADRVGRAPLLRISIVWLAAATGVCAFARDFDQLLVARALQGFAFGAEWAVGAVFIAEIASPQVRGRLLGTVQSAWGVGWGLAAAVSAVLLSAAPAEIGWRITFLVGLIPATLVFACRLRLRESPAFVGRRGHRRWHAIFAPGRVSTTLRGALLAIGMHGGYWAIATWWPAMLRTEHGLSAAGIGGHFAVLVAGSLFGYAAAAWLADRVGRRPTLVGFAIGGAVLAIACTEFAVSQASLLALSFPLGFFALGMFSVIGPVLSELFPTALRGSGLGFCYNIGRGIGGATPLLIGSRADAGSIGHTLGVTVGCAYALVLVAALLLPETLGRDLNGRA